MNVLLRRLTYRPEVKTLARALGLRGILRKWYYRWARPSDGIVNVRVAGINAQFYVRTPGELRNLDPAGSVQWEQKILELLISTVHEGDVVFDVGANVGLYSVLLAKAVGGRGQVIAFEPESECYQHLQENLKLNGLTNVRTFRKALGERRGEGKLYRGQENADSSLIAPPLGKDMGHQLVEIVQGDQFAEAEALPIPRAVKIDVEGYEYSVILGLERTLAKPACELLCCEIHPDFLPKPLRPEVIVRSVRSLGFNSLDTHPRYDTFHLVARKVGFSS
jgi:FkbM family methyltransferase